MAMGEVWTTAAYRRT